MFRKLSEGLSSAGDRLASAASSVMGGQTSSDKVQQLTALGFDATMAQHTLQATNGNVDQAAELLLAQGSPATVYPSTATSASHSQSPNRPPQRNDDDDEVLQRVLQQSVQDEHRRQQQQTTASRKAGEAALARAGAAGAAAAAGRNNGKTQVQQQRYKSPTSTASSSHSTTPPPRAPTVLSSSGGLSQHHPDVKIIPKLRDKSKEEQILRCADRLKNSPQAVDTLHRALTTIQANPNESKYRTINQTTVAYQKNLATAPGAEDLLLAMSFRQQHNLNTNRKQLVLDKAMVDPALLFLGISALEQTKLTFEYLQGKRKLVFQQELSRILPSADTSEAEALKRSEHLSHCPSEPSNGHGALMQVVLGDLTVLRRRFDSDDTLNDVLHWLGAHGSEIYERILSREWSLVDLNHYPIAPFDAIANGNHTLQYLGCWPSGKLELQPSTEEWKQQGSTATQRRTSRGLGSVPSEAL